MGGWVVKGFDWDDVRYPTIVQQESPFIEAIAQQMSEISSFCVCQNVSNYDTV